MPGIPPNRPMPVPYANGVANPPNQPPNPYPANRPQIPVGAPQFSQQNQPRPQNSQPISQQQQIPPRPVMPIRPVHQQQPGMPQAQRPMQPNPMASQQMYPQHAPSNQPHPPFPQPQQMNTQPQMMPAAVPDVPRTASSRRSYPKPQYQSDVIPTISNTPMSSTLPSPPNAFTPSDSQAAFQSHTSIPDAFMQPQVSQNSFASTDNLTQQFSNLGVGAAPQKGQAVPHVPFNLLSGPPAAQEMTDTVSITRKMLVKTLSGSPNAYCNPAFKRCTLNHIPSTPALFTKCKLPFAVLLSPYRKLGPGEEPVPVINPEAIIRCRRCRTYINPFVHFHENGTRWRCNLCYLSNDVPAFFDWDAETRQQVDRMMRPELTHSVIEYIAPQEYMVRPPQPVVMLFLIDVSFASVQSGMLDVLCKTLLDNLDSIPNADSRTKVGFIGVDSQLHFFNLNVSLVILFCFSINCLVQLARSASVGRRRFRWSLFAASWRFVGFVDWIEIRDRVAFAKVAEYV